jgi:hypothetical protein
LRHAYLPLLIFADVSWFRVWVLDGHSFEFRVRLVWGNLFCWDLTTFFRLDSLFCEDVEVSICIMVWRSLGVMRLGVNDSEYVSIAMQYYVDGTPAQSNASLLYLHHQCNDPTSLLLASVTLMRQRVLALSVQRVVLQLTPPAMHQTPFH